jgi:hypothetical protein
MLRCCVLGVLTLAVVVAAPLGASAAKVRRARSTAAPGSIGLRLVDGQAAAPDDPRASVYIVDHLAPGSVIRRHVEVSNTTTSTTHVVLYSAAASIANGAFVGAADRTPNELSSWTTVVPGALDVPAGGHRTAAATMTVPPDAAPGEQYGVVWAEARSTPTSASGGITQVSRVGIRVYLSVGPGGPPAADFTIESITATRPPHGRPLVVANVHNIGGRALDMSGTLRLLDGPGGLTAGPFPANLGVTLALGETEPVVIALDKRLPAGPWDARIALHSGFVHHTARTTIEFPDAGVVPSGSDRPAWVYPAIAALALLLLGLTAVLVIPRGRRRRPKSRRGGHAVQRRGPSPAQDETRHAIRRAGRRSQGRRHREPRHRVRRDRAGTR